MTTISAADYWSVLDRVGNEIPLQSFAYNITSWGGTRQAPPPLRGNNITIPHVPGDLMLDALPAARTQTLTMWVIGAETDGGAPLSGTRLAKFRTNWAQLRRLLWNRGEPFQLRKRFFDESGSLRVATATVRYAGGLAPDAQGGPQRAVFSVDLLMADPFFYSDPVTISFDSAASSSPASWTGSILGDWYARRVFISGTAVSLSNPSVVVTSGSSVANWLVQAQGLGGGVSISSPDQEALFGSDTYSPAVVHDTANDWFLLPPDSNVLVQFNADNGSWSGSFTYYPAWV